MRITLHQPDNQAKKPKKFQEIRFWSHLQGLIKNWPAIVQFVNTNDYHIEEFSRFPFDQVHNKKNTMV
jgi:hypothetical protein